MFFRVYAAIHSTKRTNVMIRNTSQDHVTIFTSSRGNTVWQPRFVITSSPYVNPTVVSNDNFTFIRENYLFVVIFNGPSYFTCTPKLTHSFHTICHSNLYFLFTNTTYVTITFQLTPDCFWWHIGIVVLVILTCHI